MIHRGIEFLLPYLRTDPGRSDLPFESACQSHVIDFAGCDHVCEAVLTVSNSDCRNPSREAGCSLDYPFTGVAKATRIPLSTNALVLSAVHFAVLYPVRSKVLLMARAHPSEADKDLYTPLMYAAVVQMTESALLLLTRSAKNF